MDAHEPELEAVSPTWLFPEVKGRATATDYLNFKISNLLSNDSSVDPRQLPFGWIVFEGPENAVAKLNSKRDGTESDVVFLDCDTVKEGRARFICTSDQHDPNSNCGLLMTGRFAETIIDLPSICHAGKHVVARGITVSSNQTLPVYLQGIANRTVFQLSFDFDSHLGKRNLGDLFFRLDYDNAGGYWQDVVNSSTLVARSLESRFVSSGHSEWQNKLDQWLEHPQVGSTLYHELDQILVSGRIDCEAGQSAYIHIRARGNVTSTVKIASTVYGRLTPNPDIDHSHLFMRADLDGEIRLDVSISGNISSSGQQGVFGAVLFPAMHDDKFEATGLAVIEAALKADVAIKVDTDMEGNFTTNLRFRTPSLIIRAWPEKYHASKGAVPHQDPILPFEGWIGEIHGDGELHVDFQPMVGARVVLDPKIFRDRRRGAPMAFNDQFWTSISAQTRMLANATTESDQRTWNLSTSVGSLLAQIQDPNAVGRHDTAFGTGDATMINDATDERFAAHGQANHNSGHAPIAEEINDSVNSVFNGFTLSCSRTDRSCKDRAYTCKFNLCKLFPNVCPLDNGDDESAEEIDQHQDAENIDRSELFSHKESLSPSSPDWMIKAGGKPRKFEIHDPNQPSQPLVIHLMAYPYSSILFHGPYGAQVLPEAFDYEKVDDCGNVEIPMSWFKRDWNREIFVGLPGIGGARGKSVSTPNQRISHALGSNLNRKHLVLTNQEINSDRKKCDDPALFLKWIKATCRLRGLQIYVRAQLQIVSDFTQGATGLPELWDVFFRDLTKTIEDHACTWMIHRMEDIVKAVNAAPKKPDNLDDVVADLPRLSRVVPNWSLLKSKLKPKLSKCPTLVPNDIEDDLR
ncbi:hypothetical protein BST61_g10462 [Cercospora zeina]